MKNLDIFKVSQVPRGGAVLGGHFGMGIGGMCSKSPQKCFLEATVSWHVRKGPFRGRWVQGPGGGGTLDQKCLELHETSKKCSCSKKKIFGPWVKNLEIFRVSQVLRGGAVPGSHLGIWILGIGFFSP